MAGISIETCETHFPTFDIPGSSAQPSTGQTEQCMCVQKRWERGRGPQLEITCILKVGEGSTFYLRKRDNKN